MIERASVMWECETTDCTDYTDWGGENGEEGRGVAQSDFFRRNVAHDVMAELLWPAKELELR